MPFTLSHPAIVLPFSRIKSYSICLSALIIGSMTPDFEYFLKMKLSGRFGHSFVGAFVFDLPLAFILIVIFHLIVKNTLISNLPEYLQNRYQPLKEFNLQQYIQNHPWLLLSGLLLGIFSHIIWDSFTHARSILTENINLLHTPVTLWGATFPLFRVFQHVSTLIGALYIATFVHQLPQNKSNNSLTIQSLSFWLVLLGFATLIFVARALMGFEYFGDIVASTLGAGFISLIITCLIFRRRHG